jgi:hypothetical protein
MKIKLPALALLLLLGACAHPCKEAPLQTLANSPFQNYRLGELIVEPAADPEETGSSSEAVFQNVYRYKPLIYTYAEPVIESWFSKPIDKGYAQAPVVHVVCSVDKFTTSTQGFFENDPAEFSGTITLIDPGTNKPILSKRCEKKAQTVPKDALNNYCDQSFGKPGLNNALNQCALEFSNEMKSLALQPQPTPGAVIEGTLVDVLGFHTIKTLSFWESFWGAEEKRHKDIVVNRIARDMLPNAIKRAVVESNTSFNNSSSKIYKVSTTIKSYDMSFNGIFSKGSLQYTAETTVFMNSMKLLSFDYTSPKFMLADRDKEFAKHAKYIVDYLKKNATSQKQ